MDSQTKDILGNFEKGAIIGSTSGSVIWGIMGSKKSKTVLGVLLGGFVINKKKLSDFYVDSRK